jgi:Tfp pilus assembly ATPase PilU
MDGPVAEMRERRLAELVVLQLPEIVQALVHVETHGLVIRVSDTGRN